MKHMRLWCPWRLKLRSLCLVLLTVALALTLMALYRRVHLPQMPAPPTAQTVKAPSLLQTFFGADSDDASSEFVQIERQWKVPRWRMADVLRRVSAMKQKLVPVVVVEEHYEVLKYWFDAVDAGAIPKSGNTLLHIDGHSDAAPPRDLSVIPWYRLPRNHSEVANMMQSNDVFIAGATIAGLINRFIWVWPDWDRPDHVNESDHDVFEVKAGWRTYYPPNGAPFLRHCACIKSRQSRSTSVGWECWNDEADLSHIGGPIIKSNYCEAVLTAVGENVHESKALELLKRGDWIKPDEKVLLDIDEDYFGCESSGMPLYKAGLTQVFLDKLSDLLNKFLCANDVHSEGIADKIFRTAVRTVRDFRANVCEKKPPHDDAGCISEFEADKALIQMIPKFLKSVRKAGASKLLCHGKGGEVIFQIILRMLFNLNVRQLDSLNYVGVCLVTAPTSMVFEPYSLHVCHGFNTPNDTAVSFHVPTVEENTMRSGILRNTLSLLPQQPTLVTVCRSVRDGYTPWAFFSYIEKSVMDSLQSVFPGVRKESFHFDENLLGGKKGWPDRHPH